MYEYLNKLANLFFESQNPNKIGKKIFNESFYFN